MSAWDGNINLAGLRQILRKFDENGRLAVATHWKIARGGYDQWWELYYDEVPAVDCCAGEIEKEFDLDEALYRRIKDIILEEYPDLKAYN